MIAALIKSIQSAFHPEFFRIIFKAFLGSLVLFGLLLTLTWYGLTLIKLFDIAWLETLLDSISWVVIVIVSWFLFPGTVIMVMGFFIEDLIMEVEKKFYPDLDDNSIKTQGDFLWSGFKFGLLTLSINLAALPILLLFSFLPPLNIFVFTALNGYLLGREYFELIACRRLQKDRIRNFWKRNRVQLIFSGMMITFLYSIPVINFLMPAIGVAFMVHTFHRIWQKKHN